MPKEAKVLTSYEEIHKDTKNRQNEIERGFRLAALRGRDSRCGNQMTIFDRYVQPLREQRVRMGLDP